MMLCESLVILVTRELVRLFTCGVTGVTTHPLFLNRNGRVMKKKPLRQKKDNKMATTTDIPITKANEPERIRSWKVEELIEAGYDWDTAEQLADHPTADWRLAIRLRKDGCPRDTAVAICT